MSVTDRFGYLQEELGTGELATAVLILAESVEASSQLTLKDGDAIGHGIYMALNSLLEQRNINIGVELIQQG